MDTAKIVQKCNKKFKNAFSVVLKIINKTFENDSFVKTSVLSSGEKFPNKKLWFKFRLNGGVLTSDF